MKKRRFPVLLIILGSLLISYHLDAQNLFWSNQIGGTGDDGAKSGCCDKEGNFYIAGHFKSLECYFQKDTLVRHGIDDLFLAKYDPSGNELWVRRLGGWNSYTNEYIRVYYDKVTDHIFLTGGFSGEIDFGSYVLSSGGGNDVFLVKYDLEGQCVWAVSGGGTGDDLSNIITFDNLGNIFMTGTTTDTANFGTNIIPAGGFIAKFDPEGNCKWAKNKFAWISYFDSKIRIGGIKVYNSDIYLGGSVSVRDTVRIDTILTGGTGMLRSLVICLDSNGTAKWVKEGFSKITESLSDIAIDNSGNIYQTGSFHDSIVFGGNVIKAPGSHEMFLVKYDKTGRFLWARNSQSNGAYTEGLGLTLNNDGNVFTTGSYTGNTYFGDFYIHSNGLDCMFLAGYDSLGKCLGVYHFFNGYGTGLTHDSDGNLFLSALLSGSATLGSKTYNTYGGYDLIIAKCSEITGIEEPEKDLSNRLLIYANPTTGKCNITIPDEFLNEKKLTLQVFDSQGRLVQQAPVEITDGKIRLNIEAQAKGTYTVILSNGKKSYSGKIIFR
jgi:hypothetical protein